MRRQLHPSIRRLAVRVQRVAPVLPAHVYVYLSCIAIEIVFIALAITISFIWMIVVAGILGFVLVIWGTDFWKDYDEAVYWGSSRQQNWMRQAIDVWQSVRLR